VVLVSALVLVTEVVFAVVQRAITPRGLRIGVRPTV
jgi:hypothetical protein